MKTIFYVIAVAAAAIGVFVYLTLDDTQKTIPKINLSYFVDEKEIADSVAKRLTQEISAESFFWIGVEPEKNEQLEVVLKLKEEFEKSKPFKTVIVDKELRLPKAWLEKFKTVEEISVKDDETLISKLLSDLEVKSEKYLVITAAIYSTSTILKNQIRHIKEMGKINPMTFSLAYFPTTSEDEKNMMFPCMTEDHAGTSNWGCAVANKARFIRRKIDSKIQKPWIGLMDLTGEKDYMILLKKR